MILNRWLPSRTGWILAASLALLSGCSREHYRVAADKDAYGLLAEKANGKPWQLPFGYDIVPHPLSRFHDPTCLEDPLLPQPAPQLYAYPLPPLAGSTRGNREAPRASGEAPRPWPPSALPGPLPPAAQSMTGRAWIKPVSYWAEPGPPGGPAIEAELPSLDAIPAGVRDALVLELTREREFRIKLSDEAWKDLSRSCLTRIFEFDSVREEYFDTFGRQPPDEYLERSPRLTLEDIIHLASINSREYQAQKETLYRSALRLSLERYDYALKFSTSGNRAAANYDHSWNEGRSQSELVFPASLQVDKLLATGGEVLARFANDVVLTFNGPQGFAADITTDVLFDISQTVFQRDIRLEPLTQSERDIVYATRNFARYRKTLFNQLASDYYRLILSFRQIEISAISYFQLVRAFQQNAAEYDAGQRSRVQVDQVEQSLLEGRSRLITTCNALETALDNLKIRIGLPTETLLNIDLREINELTRRDELSVTSDLIRRARKRIVKELNAEGGPELERDVVVRNTSVTLLDRMIEAMELKAELGQDRVDARPLRIQVARLRVQLARLPLRAAQEQLAAQQQQGTPSVPELFQRTADAVQALRDLSVRQYRFIELVEQDRNVVNDLAGQLLVLMYAHDVLKRDLEKLIEAREIGRLPEFLNRAIGLQNTWAKVAQRADALAGMSAEVRPAEEEWTESVAEAQRVSQLSEPFEASVRQTLVPVDVPMDDAMLTALVLRLDLQNEREQLADDWRRIKLAADELKSILNLNASQTLRSTRSLEVPFEDTTDSAQTRVRITFDAPLNRRSQRNAYRQSLIDYNVGLRSLMQLEDNTKLSVRNDLRSLSIAQEQYVIDVAKAALAYERVVSTELELRLGIGNVAVRDYLEAQSAYISSLSSVAGRHIGYITDRTQLFLDLELLTVGDDGFWDGLYDDKLQPEPYFQLPPYAMPAYGELPVRAWHSQLIRRMCGVPTGVSAVHQESPPSAAANVSPPPEAVSTPRPQTP